MDNLIKKVYSIKIPLKVVRKKRTRENGKSYVFMDISKKYIESLIQTIDSIIDYCLKLEKEYSNEIHSVHPSYRKSARNLMHYMALRNYDIRKLQESLAELGLSSLGRSESHVLSSLYFVRDHLCRIIGKEVSGEKKDLVDFKASQVILAQNTKALLGESRKGRRVRIMVTLSAPFAENYKYIRKLLRSGMDCARINCAHDNKESWIRIIDNIQRAKKETGIPCKILMDLAGLKLRTGPLHEGPRVLRIKVKRDYLGKPLGPTKIWLAPLESIKPKDVNVKIPVDRAWLKNLQPGDKILFLDKRGKKRQFEITSCEEDGCRADLFKRSFIEMGTTLTVQDKKRNIEPSEVGPLPSVVLPVVVRKDDILLITSSDKEGENAKYDETDKLIAPAHISCSNPEIFRLVKDGDPILFNDGKIEGIVTSSSKDMLIVKITQAKTKGSKLGKDKGINLPETDFGITGLQNKDIEDLSFVARHADIANLSFANYPDDVYQLTEELNKLNAPQVATMLKIETQIGFKNLPKLLLAAMKSYPSGVMIARGDLAVECGWRRLAEIQEEILWLCEAAHVPVVWATQVLEEMAKKGSPSRAEITDAAMSQRAECVMLNKGPHIRKAIETLSDILSKMEAHQNKKTSMLRHLSLSEIFKPESTKDD